MSSCPKEIRHELEKSLAILEEGLDELSLSCQLPIEPLVPRPALLLIGHITSSCYLLEHLTWSYSNNEPERYVDIEVFRRWVLEGGTAAVIEDVKCVKQNANQRIQTDSALVFGTPYKAKL